MAPIFRGLQTRPNSHLPAREAPKDQNRHVQIRAPKPSSVSSEQEQTYTNSHPLVEDTPAEDLLAAGGANSGRFGARWHLYRDAFAAVFWSGVAGTLPRYSCVCVYDIGTPLSALLWLAEEPKIGADFWEVDLDSSFSIFGVRRFTEWPGPLHWIAFPVEILTKPLIHWIPPPFSLKTPSFSLKSASSDPLPKNRLLKNWRRPLLQPGLLIVLGHFS